MAGRTANCLRRWKRFGKFFKSIGANGDGNSEEVENNENGGTLLLSKLDLSLEEMGSVVVELGEWKLFVNNPIEVKDEIAKNNIHELNFY